MQKRYTITPEFIKFSDINKDDFILSSSLYEKVNFKNTNGIFLKELLSCSLSNEFKGSDVGSDNYVDQSPYTFLRTKALQDFNYLPDFNKESLLRIKPSSFKEMNLKKGDLILSKDSNIGEITILDDDYPKMMISSAMYKLPIEKDKYYIFAFIKHSAFREQLDLLVPKGATIRHAKTLFLECSIIFPKKNREKIIDYIETLVKSVIKKEKLIKIKHEKILHSIENEIASNQKDEVFTFSQPTISELKKKNRLDTNLYGPYFKEINFKIKNYKYGYSTLKELGYELSRGQNLQISNIGRSIYSKRYRSNFYELMLPKFLSKYGTVNKVEYLGNSNKLKILKKGELIFGAEGFEKGRSIVIIDEKEKVITNIHGITIRKKREQNLKQAIFIKCFLDYLRSKGVIDLFAVGGNGGSLAQKYWDEIYFPNLSEIVQDAVSNLYYNPEAHYKKEFDMDTFCQIDEEFNSKAGIYELDKSMKLIKNKIDEVIDAIVKDDDPQLTFDFLKTI